MIKTTDVLILGGGLSGLTACHLLQQRGVDCILLEKEAHAGGLTRTRIANGYTFDAHGGHVFNTKNPRVREWVFSILPESQWQYSKRIAKILYDGKIVSYPFELALGELDPDEAVECILGLMGKRAKAPDNFGDWLRWNFGTPISKKYLIPYNKKIWRRDLRKMSAHWVKGKMPIPDLKEILHNAIAGKSDETKMVHSTYYYPKNGGIWGFVGRIHDALENLHCSAPLVSLEKSGGYFIANGEYRAKKLISTIPIPELASQARNIPDSIMTRIKRLQSNAITTVLCRQQKGMKLSWLYLPAQEFPAHRIVYQGGLSNSACPRGKYSATYEMTGRHNPSDVVSAFEDKTLQAELRSLGTLDYEHTKYAYPVYHMGFQKDIIKITRWLDGAGIISCGRFAQWRYMNMDDCIASAFDAADLIKPNKKGR